MKHLPDPSLQELMPFFQPDWMLCQSLPLSKPPVLGRHSCEPPELGLQLCVCHQLRLSLPLSPLSALPTSSLQQLSSEHCPALGAAVLLLSELSWARQIHPGACKQCQRAGTCFGQSREFAVRGCSGNVTVQDPKGLPPPPPHCQGHQGVCNASSTWVKTLTESSIHPSIRPSLPQIFQAHREHPSHEAAAPCLCLASLRAAKHHLALLICTFNPKIHQISPKRCCRYTAQQVMDV